MSSTSASSASPEDLHAARIGLLVGRQSCLAKQPGQAEDAVQRRAELVTDGGEHARLRLARRLGPLARFDQRPLDLLALGDVARDRIDRSDGAGFVPHLNIDPGEPTRTGHRLEFEVARSDIGGRAIPLSVVASRLDRPQLEPPAGERVGRHAEGLGEGLIDEGDPSRPVGMDDEASLGLDQAAIALFAFTQFPCRIGERLEAAGEIAIVGREPADLGSEPPLVDPGCAP